MWDFARREGEGEGSGRAYPCRMPVAGEAPREEPREEGATRPVVAASKGRDREREREKSGDGRRDSRPEQGVFVSTSDELFF